MLRSATWKSWTVPAVLFVALIIIGVTRQPAGTIVDWIYKIGTLGATFAPLLGIAAWTLSGRKWWQNDVGTALVQALLAIVVVAGPLCWAIWVNQGRITGGLIAWIEVSGPLFVTATVGWLFFVLLRASKDSGTRPAA